MNQDDRILLLQFQHAVSELRMLSGHLSEDFSAVRPSVNKKIARLEEWVNAVLST